MKFLVFAVKHNNITHDLIETNIIDTVLNFYTKHHLNDCLLIPCTEFLLQIIDEKDSEMMLFLLFKTTLVTTMITNKFVHTHRITYKLNEIAKIDENVQEFLIEMIDGWP